jgi:hypothetical protein
MDPAATSMTAPRPGRAKRLVDDVRAPEAPAGDHVLYMPDEPRPPEYPRIVALADNIHSNPGPGRALPIFVTSRYVEPLVDEVLGAIVPRVFSDAGDRVSFPEAGDPYEAARLRLARASEQKNRTKQ